MNELIITVEPPNKGDFGTNINAIVLSFVLFSEVQNVLKTNYLGPLRVSFVERFIITVSLCPLS